MGDLQTGTKGPLGRPSQDSSCHSRQCFRTETAALRPSRHQLTSVPQQPSKELQRMLGSVSAPGQLQCGISVLHRQRCFHINKPQLVPDGAWRPGPPKTQPQAFSYVWASGSLPSGSPLDRSFLIVTSINGLLIECHPIPKQNIPCELSLDWQDSLVDKVCQPEFDSWVFQGKRRVLIPAICLPHTCCVTHVHTCTK